MNWISKLQALDQEHLINAPGQTDDDRRSIFSQLELVDANYPGGLEAYIDNAKRLLEAAKKGVDVLGGYNVSLPRTIRIDCEDERTIMDYEATGRQCAGQVGFVLVAGGLGERLGYPDIKLKLYVEVIQPMTYIEYYCRSILTIQDKSNGNCPLFIMTSSDTHAKTEAFLKENGYFGLREDQVFLRQQEKVPSIINNSGHIALDSNSRIATKPHGHGDVHLVLYSSGLLDHFRSHFGTKWLFFFQDTNALSFRALLPMLGASKEHGLGMNSLAIPRLGGEAIGAICGLEKGDERMVLNVEYNQLESLIKSSAENVEELGKPSRYPGNCNILLFDMEKYEKALEASKGLVPEFVNPKYADSSREKFKTPTRVECMMQDIARCFGTEHACTVMDRWFVFSTCKNNCDDASKKVTPECAFSAESDLYYNCAKSLQLAARIAKPSLRFQVSTAVSATFNNVRYPLHPPCWIHPSCAVSLSDLVELLKSVELEEVRISHDEAFIVSRDRLFKNLRISQFAPIQTEEDDCNYKVRGYRVIAV